MSDLFAKRLKMYRLERGMSQLEVAKDVGLTRSAINNYESAASEPTFEVLCRISQILNVPIAALISEHYEEEPKPRELSDEDKAVLALYHNTETLYKPIVLDLMKEHQKE